jgi:thioredoxin-like negative regulator of GroEL
VQLDPNFWEAWVEIARMNFSIYLDESMGGPTDRLIAGQAAVAQAVRLAPQDPKVLRIQATEAHALKDEAKAEAILKDALDRFPTNVEILISLANHGANERNWTLTMGYVQRALALDPRNPLVLWGAYNSLITLRQWGPALKNAQLLQELQPESKEAAAAAAAIPFLEHGSTRESEDLIAKLTPEELKDPGVLANLQDWYFHYKGDAQAYIDLCDRQGQDLNFNQDDSALQYSEALIMIGQKERAASLTRPIVERLVAESAKNPGDYAILSSLAYAQGLLGQHDVAMATIATVLGTIKPGDSLRKQFYLRTNMAIVYGWIGEKDKCVDTLLPYTGKAVNQYFNVNCMRNDIDYFPMRGFPRWEALLTDPRNIGPVSY